MIPLKAGPGTRNAPLVTWTISLLCAIVYVWDRNGHIFGPSITFSDLAMRPKEVILALTGHGSAYSLVTIFTSMFLHGGLLHILGNLLFLMVFGPMVEQALGPARFALYYLFWGVVASMAQVFVDPSSMVATLGASGAIAGVLGAYFLLFPGSKVEIIVPILLFIDFEVSAWVMLGLWFAYQIFIPQDGVANWAHAGGFLAGMVCVLLMGGRKVLLKGREREFTDDLYTPSTT